MRWIRAEHARRNGIRVLALGAALALVLAGCGGDDDDDDASGSDATTTTTSAGADADVVVASAETGLGEVLVDAEGMTLYVFDNDSPDTSACSDDCASNWPPLETSGDTVAVGSGIDAEIFGTITRDDGKTQVTVNGLPLYTFAGDAAAGDTNGQGVGDIWWAVSADGEKIEAAAAGATTTEASSLGY